MKRILICSLMLLSACAVAPAANVTTPLADLDTAAGWPANSSLIIPATTTSGDPNDAAFLGLLRSNGLLPKQSGAQKGTIPITDDQAVADGQDVCNTLTTILSSATDAVKRGELFSMAQSTTELYGISMSEAGQLVILSTQAYCPKYTALAMAVVN